MPHGIWQGVVNFLIGFLPPAVVGLALTLIGGPGKIYVYCNTTTPIPPSWNPFAMYAGPCAQIMQVPWVPNWNALWLVPIGLGLGLWLALRETPYQMDGPLQLH